MKKQIAALLMILVLCVGGAFAEENLQAQYDAAKELLASEQYEAAAEAFEALGSYEDSKEHWKRARYNIALKHFDAEEYHEAEAIFEELGDYRNSKKNAYTSYLRARIIDYKEAKAVFKAGDYETAKVLFEALGNYEESKKYVKEAEAHIQAALQAQAEAEAYEKAVKYLEAKDYKAAYDAFILAGPVEGATDGMYEAVYGMAREKVYAEAQEALTNGENALAKLRFETLGDYLDSAEQAKAITVDEALDAQEETYQKAHILRQLWKREEANALFAELGDYKDASDRVEIIAPKIAAVRLRDDATTDFSEVFTAPDGSEHYYRIFKGVHTWVEAKFFCELMGGHLATITSHDENEFVYWFMRGNNFLTAYFGLSDEERVGNWIWVTGEPVEYTNWNRGEPSRSGKERYGMYLYLHEKGTWNDSHFYETDKWGEPGCSFICEWDVPADK